MSEPQPNVMDTQIFESLESFQDWIKMKYKEFNTDNIIFKDWEIKDLIEDVSNNSNLYPEHGREDSNGSLYAREFFIKLIKFAETVSLPEPYEESAASTQLFFQHLVNLITLLRVEAEADYHPEIARAVSGVIRSVGNVFSTDKEFEKYCNNEADLICPYHNNRGHRFMQGESLSEINKSPS